MIRGTSGAFEEDTNMTIFRRRPNEKFWCYKIRLGPNRWRTFKGYSDKRATHEKASQHQAQIDRGEVGLVDRYAEHKLRPLVDHVGEFIASLTGAGRDAKYVYVANKRLRRILNDIPWQHTADITLDGFEKWRSKQQEKADKPSPVTLNQHQDILSGFCNWMVRRGRMPINPIASLAKLNAAVDIRRQRRALSDAETQRLLDVSPEPRRTVYLVALLTGLRRAELEQLRWLDVHLDAPKPFLTARASTTKNAKDAVIFLRDDIATALRSLERAGDTVFEVPDIDTFKVDLAAAHIVQKDKLDRIVDFHSLRHTLATNLGRAGISIRTAMEVMRHSDARLTTRTYTDATMLPIAEAIECLPRWEVQSQKRKALVASMGDTSESIGVRTGATKCATKSSAQLGICSHDNALREKNDGSENTPINKGENSDLPGRESGVTQNSAGRIRTYNRSVNSRLLYH